MTVRWGSFGTGRDVITDSTVAFGGGFWKTTKNLDFVCVLGRVRDAYDY
jgi:hypothetical protein